MVKKSARRTAEGMSSGFVAEVHGQPVVDHRLGEASEHPGLVRGGLAARRARVAERVQIGRADVEPHLLGSDLIGGLVDMHDRGANESLRELARKGSRSVAASLAREATKPPETGSPSISDSACAVRLPSSAARGGGRERPRTLEA